MSNEERPEELAEERAGEQAEKQIEQPPQEAEVAKEKAELMIRRILVALDTSTDSLAALQAAANLAAIMEAKLMGLFVEDVNLLRLAQLPFAREVCWPTASGRPLDEERMERELRLRASQARRALAYAAEEAEAEWTFQVVRGTVTAKVLEAALEADLLSLGRASRSLGHRRLGSTARAAAEQAPGSVLLAQRGADLQRPIVVTYDGSPAGWRALAAAVRMAQTNDSNLVVLVMAEEADAAPRLAEEASTWLKERVPHANYRYLPTGNGDALVKVLQENEKGLIVLGGESELLQGGALQRLLDELDCPVMLVR